MPQPSPEPIRAEFPALSREVAGRPAVYLDGPAGTQVPRGVAAAMTQYLLRHNANDGGAFATSRETEQLQAGARATFAAFLGSGTPREIVFGPNMTSLTFAFSRALARTWAPGDEVLVTDLDHQANITPWRDAAREAGALVRTLPFDPETGILDYERLPSLLGPRTRLVAVGYASNALGTLNDMRRVIDAARAVGARTYVDAVQYAPHGPVDVQALGCDFLVCSSYKFFGPHLGILWGREELLRELTPARLPPASDEVPARWENGTPSYEGIVGAAAAVEWIAGLGREEGTLRGRVVAGMGAIEALEAPVLARLMEGLTGMRGVRVYGPPADHPRTPTVAFRVAGRTPREVAEHLGERGIFAWDGDFYASTVIDRLGLGDAGGLVRVGLAPYNTEAEVERFLEALGSLTG